MSNCRVEYRGGGCAATAVGTINNNNNNNGGAVTKVSLTQTLLKVTFQITLLMLKYLLSSKVFSCELMT